MSDIRPARRGVGLLIKSVYFTITSRNLYTYWYPLPKFHPNCNNASITSPQPNSKPLLPLGSASKLPQTPSTQRSTPLLGSAQRTPGSQRTLYDCNVQSIGSSYSRSELQSRGLVPVVILRDACEVFCQQVREANILDTKLKLADESVDPWSNCPVKPADFATKGDVFSLPWRYLASLCQAPLCLTDADYDLHSVSPCHIPNPHTNDNAVTNLYAGITRT